MSSKAPDNDAYVFLSYAREDESQVEQILFALRQRGFPVFIDRDMVSGVEWEKVLEARLQTAYAIVVVWSSRSVRSEWVEREAAVGLEKDRLFPVLLERGVSMPPRFVHKHAADLSDWNGDPNAVQFDRVISMLQLLWEAQNGLLKDTKAMKPIRFKRRPASE